MRYKMETIKKLLALFDAIINWLMEVPLDKLHVSISKGNRKIGRVMNVSTPPILACGNCRNCKHFCYDIKACLQYINVRIARCRNIVILRRDRNKFFDEIDDAITRRRKNKYFRWHVAGDIIDYDYFCRMVEIAKKHTDFTFWTYTKMYSIVNQYVKEHGNDRKTAIPDNFNVMFSEWDGMPLINPYGFKIFTCKMKYGNINHDDKFFDNLFKCPGNCDICKENNTGCIGYMDTYADEH